MKNCIVLPTPKKHFVFVTEKSTVLVRTKVQKMIEKCMKSLKHGCSAEFLEYAKNHEGTIKDFRKRSFKANFEIVENVEYSYYRIFNSSMDCHYPIENDVLEIFDLDN